MSDLETMQQIGDALPAMVDIFTLAACGIVGLVNVIKYDKCEIFIKNNHNHDIYLVLDDRRKSLLSGQYKIQSYSTSKIYKTDRRTFSVGIHAECSICDAFWGNELEKYIPCERNFFNIKENEWGGYYIGGNSKIAKFSYSSDISKRKEYTFIID